MWYELNIDCARHTADSLCEALENYGALSVSFLDKNDDPILEPEIGTTPLWPEVVIKALFDDELEATLAREAICKLQPNLLSLIKPIENENWQQRCMDDFKPQKFGNRLWICPSWQAEAEAQAVIVKLDPGLAFGTGTHPTTNLCLTWLEQADINQKIVIDYGCGSGILALAAAKLGAKQLFAVDIDPQALTATQYNAENNDLDNENFHIDYPHNLEVKADILIANILLTPLINLEEEFLQRLKPEGLLVVSGILKDQVQPLIEQYQLFSAQKTLVLDDWGLIVFKVKCLS